MYGKNLYGSSLYAIDTLNNETIESLTPNLMKYLPTYYKDSLVMNNLMQTLAKEIALINYKIEDILNQFFIDTATWGLDLWEKELGINTDIQKSYETRREVIKAKLRGQGTITKNMLKNTARAYTNAESEIIENPQDYSFIIKFIGIKGIPPNMQLLIDTIEEIKPAHLAYSFQYMYTWWDGLKTLNWTQSQNKSWNDLKIYT